MFFCEPMMLLNAIFFVFDYKEKGSHFCKPFYEIMWCTHTINRAYRLVKNDGDVYVRIVSFEMQSKARKIL